ncbi:argininosuccinate synthase [candidate division CPR3 bacterium GWF2_35_18]|uniref:Argininosuccinate synthase n=1 Tax=candidate division CPR3 bacterium GW2011_GWF2_35_18 TaxID=1618350 RepID=A0A0G0EQ35_UNCC3|nr:MAG: Argininosuccinate synthase [candidate division CPR3 bacterium GW2011_GWF2_35_18]KKP86776.1 MAG: Argininosuccinate synthase [candidate division CPR3 bacterium GW2011_GWE2_35_7]OGB62921.1 MAG: argininosuccinate synthase [candidate division CPR3 bacterium GWF2_35_18]OGB65953.1 MAG: argininosuccinate synthase [candidate division CPR3 bacterium RIFOXYA2_FULL_35_13]OGB76273.1 MAG: argininosuccinate synthase [candidate division CPR3 bacterium RIFOXYC2_FULL_35_7]OGB78514.1 MAG: argininosuccina
MNKNYIKASSYEAKIGQVKKVVLLYSGGLDTSVMLKWIQDNYKAKVIALTMDLGQQGDDLEFIKKKALNLGAEKIYVINVKDEFANEYISKLIKANGAYQGNYYISTISRYLMAKWAIKIAKQENADAIAHGCTGKGNDQVRIEASALTLNPDIKIIAPVREWSMGRDEEIEYAAKNGIPVPVKKDFPYSVDDNMWGMTWESGEIEDPSLIPPIEKFLNTHTLPENAPDKAEFIKIKFSKGIPVSINEKEMKLSDLIIKLNKIAGKHGVGIVHHIEDRLVGLKVRGVYEMPAAHVIMTAHKNLEKYVNTMTENELKNVMDIKWSYLVYGSKWYEPVLEAINAFNDKINEKVEGEVTIKLYKGSAEVVAITSPYALYDHNLATFMKDYTFNQNASPGFVEIFSLQMKLANQVKSKN